MINQNDNPAGASPSTLASSSKQLSSQQLAQAHQEISSLREQVGNAIIGQQQVIDQTLICLLAGGHALVEGVPGLGKTLLVRALAKAVGVSFNRVQFTPDLMPSDIVGHTMFDMKTSNWRVRRGPVFCHFLLADEINRAPAKTQSALLEVMQEQQVTIEGKSFELDRPFLTIATQNPIEQEGTYPLPEAQLDRFLLNILIDYPSEQEELEMIRNVTAEQVGDKLNIDNVVTVSSPERLLTLQKITAHILVDESISDYATRIVRATRQWNGIAIGAGPRGGISLIRAARAHALLAGNHFVTPDDVKTIAPAVLRHRVSLTPDYEIEGYSKNDVIATLLENIAAPRQ